LTPVGEGDLDVRGQLAALANDGYTRFVSLETHWRPAAPLAEATVRLPGGRVFSENAAAATIRCLQNWDNILQTTG
jgi:sugar phosphate isomerase/epimerase